MSGASCPGELELARALGGAPDDAVAAHVAGCVRCRAICEATERAIALARQLPVPAPPPGRREEVRAALLAQAAVRPVRVVRWLGTLRGLRGAAWLGGAAALAAAAAAVLVVRARPHDVAARPPAALRASPGADYALASAPPEEVVRLRDGTLAIEVEPLEPGQRFRVVVGDGEVEVRGTAFEITAARDRLVAVRVERGRVEVRPRDAAAAVVGPGQSWKPPAATDAPSAASALAAPPAAGTEPARARRGPARLAGRAVAAPARERPAAHLSEEVAYDDAWDAMRAADFRRAAAAFARVQTLSPAGALADDGAFWRAVALARGGSPTGAAAAFREMLTAYPASPRRGQASAMLGWLLVDAHELGEAADRFRAAAADPSDAVRASAQKGLEALASM